MKTKPAKPIDTAQLLISFNLFRDAEERAYETGNVLDSLDFQETKLHLQQVLKQI